MRKHPSGRPQREEKYRRLPIVRPPRDGYLTPGLRERNSIVNAIGFHAQIARDDPNDEDHHG